MASNTIDLAEIGALVGDPARAAMLCTLMDGRAQTAGELAYAAGLGPHGQRTSEAADGEQAPRRGEAGPPPLLPHRHAARGADDRIDGNGGLPPDAAASPADPRARCDDARGGLCYDHLAGRLGMAITDALSAKGCITLGDEGGEVTPKGFAFFARHGIALEPNGKRAFCRPCLDWSERRFHIAGQTGAALASHCFEQGWIEHVRDGRAVVVTDVGREAFADLFGVDLLERAEAA